MFVQRFALRATAGDLRNGHGYPWSLYPIDGQFEK